MALNVFEVVLGAAIVVAVLLDVFQSIVTPRPVGGMLRISRFVLRGACRPSPRLQRGAKRSSLAGRWST